MLGRWLLPFSLAAWAGFSLAACAGPKPVVVPPEDTGCEATSWYRDNDRDGFGDPARGTSTACVAPEGYVAVEGDCDDADDAVFPGAVESCDDADDDCDGAVDEGAADARTWYADVDQDRFGDPATALQACDAPSGRVADGTDCDDTDAGVSPEAWETCDGRDQDCDGAVDEDAVNAATWFLDADGDDHGDPAVGVEACEAPAGWVSWDTDCDDTDAAVSPDGIESCNDRDDDCDGTVDEPTARDAATWYADTDADGFGDAAATVRACTVPAGYGADATDCDDTDAATSPAGTEVCGGADEDCDGTVDEPDAADAATWYADLDGDGFGDPAVSEHACDAPTGYGADATDCDDADATVSPAGTELCGGADEDCDGTVDEPDAADAAEWYADADGDGRGDAAVGSTACDAPAGFLADATDCDDTDATVSPDALETCDTRYVDDDCDGILDEPDALAAATWYADGDIDGRGDPATSFTGCNRPYGYVTDASDCDDTDAWVHPGMAESCATAADDDCSGDAYGVGASDCTDWYVDADGDGVGGGTAECACTAHGLYVTAEDGDCDDADPTIHTGAVEVWSDDIDQSCDGFGDADLLANGAIRLRGEAAYDFAGASVAAAGDLDGDGNADLLVGAQGLDRGAASGGGAYVVYGPVAGDASLATADHVLLGAYASDGAGYAVAGGGDTDGDGVPDLLVGAPYSDRSGYDVGVAYLLAAPTAASASLSTAVATIEGTSVGGLLGSGVALPGDLDGDGLDEIVTLAPSQDTPSVDCGALAIFAGPLSGTVAAASADAQLYGHAGYSLYFADVARLGDADGDGLDDLLVGQPRATDTASWQGGAFLYYGLPTTGFLDDAADAQLIGEAYNDQAGTSVSGAGDRNGDGYADLLVGAPYTTGLNTGTVYLVYSPPAATLNLSAADATIQGVDSSSWFGKRVAGDADIDGDGSPDIAVAAAGDSDRTVDGGALHLFFGAISGSIDSDDADAILDGADHLRAGQSLAVLGDTNGDGLDDLVFGSPEDPTAGSQSGAAWLVVGR